MTLKQALWEIVRDKNIIITNQNIDWLLDRAEKRVNDNIIGFCNVCMNCGAIVERSAIKNNSGKLNFCPNCGARMRGVENE